MPDSDAYQHSVLPEPADPPLNVWRGQKVTPSRMVDLWTRHWDDAAWDKQNVKRARDFRRGDLAITLDPDFLKDHPELSWVVSKMAERGTLEAEQIARATSVLPKVSREALGEREMDDRHAEQYERYMQDWVEQYVPRKESGVKLVEDGSHGGIVLPAEIDLDGEPDYYDRIDERAYAALARGQQDGYAKDEADTKGRYVKKDADGRMVPHPKWDRDEQGKPRGDRTDFTRHEGKSQEAHDKARERYLANQQAINVRLIRALDAVPIWGPGKGREPFELLAIIERRLVSVEDALGAKLGWKGMGNRRLLPRGYNDTRTTGQNGDYYLYTLYCLSEKDEDGCEHPLIFSCLGGYGTWSTAPRHPSGGTAEDKDSVVMLDLYESHGLTGPLWTWVGGMSTGDDSPHHRTRPWLHWFIDEILSIEGTTTQLKVNVALNASTGYSYKPDAKLAEVDKEAVLETLPAGKRLRPPVRAKPGQIVTNAGDITPQMAANVGADAWRLNADEKAHLLAITTGGTPDAASGNALLVDQSIKAVNQAQVRDGMAAFTKFCAETGARIFAALSKTHKTDWPLASTKKPAVGPDGKQPKINRPHRTITTFSREWLGDEQNVKLTAEFPSEENLARIDLERSLKKDRLASFKDVQDARAKEDAFDVRLEIAKDDLWDMPENIALFNQRVAEIVGNRRMLKILRLKAAQQMQDGGVLGMAQGIPAAMLKRRQDVMDKQAVSGQGGGGGSGGPPLASSIRGGVHAGQMNAARDAQATQSAMQSAPTQQGVA